MLLLQFSYLHLKGNFMSRPKKKSVALPQAEKRLSGMRSIDSNLDFGQGFSNDTFAAHIENVRSSLDAYNTLLSQVDKAANTFANAEQTLCNFSSKMLAYVAIQYDKNSDEYEMAGGSRQRKSRRSPRKKPETNAA
jgi:hypothetical protein